MTRARLELTTIGFARSPFHEKMQAPRQPGARAATPGRIELLPGHDFEHALLDLESFRYIWVLFWFHEADGYRPKVLPPRSSKRRGVFATRSPHRPNPLGLSLLELTARSGLVLEVADLDLLDGTPIFDIKPYLPYADQRADAGHGWIDEERGQGQRDPLPVYTLERSADAERQLELLRSRFGIELWPRIAQVLELGPAPHPYRRIRERGDHFTLALKDYRVDFRAEGQVILVLSIATGYKPSELAQSDAPALDPHRALLAFRR